MMTIGVGVAGTHSGFDAYLTIWTRCRDVCAGQDAIHAKGAVYLKPLTEQTPQDYIAYRDRAGFYNASWRTVGGFIGMLFRKPATLVVPEKAKSFLEDVTGSGVSFQTFAQDCALEDLTVSRLGVLVDHPPMPTDDNGRPKTITLAEAERLGLRPVMQIYKAEAITNWRYGQINNKNVLTQVRLLEEAVIEKSEFEIETELRIKVLDIFGGKYRIRVFKKDNEEQIGGDVFPTMNGKPLTYIPFYFIGPDGTDGALTEPVLIDLFNVNVKHYQVTADYEHGCHFVGLPTPVISGYQQAMDGNGNVIQESFYIGSSKAWVFPDPNTKAEFLEFSGQGLGALEKNLDRKEAQMAAIGARMLAPEKSGVEAEGTLAIRHSGEDSILSAIAIAVSSGLEKALKTFCEWANAPGEVIFKINRLFVPRSVDSQTLTAWLGLVQAGAMSLETLFTLLQEADMQDAELTFEEEQTRIAAQPLPEPEPPTTKTSDNPDDQ